MTTCLFRQVDLQGRPADVRIAGGKITEIGRGLTQRGNDKVVDGRGGALIPGLHDHHLHVLALAAAGASVDLSNTPTPAEQRIALEARARLVAPGTAIRATGFHERPGDRALDRSQLDEWCPDNPTRVQHRGGALWILNTKALAAFDLLDSSDIERDVHGAPTGRLLRIDERLRTSDALPDTAGVGRELSALGITRATDATPGLSPRTIHALAAAVTSGELPVRLTLLGAPQFTEVAGIAVGPEKVLLHDHNLPTFDELFAKLHRVHQGGRPVAVHCVTRESLVLTLAALRSSGALPGDRIEHGAVVPPELRAELRDLGLTVVTQPDFVRTRGDDYLVEVHPDDLPYLYPYRSLLDHGIRVLPSSDAPFGVLDPWQAIRSARSRKTSNGHTLGDADRVPPKIAMSGYWNGRTIEVGMPADVVLLHVPLSEALARPDATLVRATFA